MDHALRCMAMPGISTAILVIVTADMVMPIPAAT